MNTMVAEAGSDVDAYCSKCRMELMHVVIACDAKKILRVECKTCRGQHAYKHVPASANKKGTGVPKAKKKVTRAAGAKGSRGKPSAYDEAIVGRDISQAVAYQTSETFVAGDVINHQTFGIGVVTRLLSDAKVQVAFDGSEKVLIHARA
jgi:hypothetical protein